MPGSAQSMILAAASLALLGLQGCASPRYQTVYRYEPPTDPAGLACLARCEEKLAACQADCRTRYQACARETEPLVEDRYAAALQAYADELDRYRLELRQYDFGIWASWHHGGFWYQPGPYHGWPYYGWPYYGWPGPYAYSSPSPPPPRPTRESVQAQLRKEKCVDDCGCQPNYDACFLACGGRRIPETRCVADCPRPD
ncbi:MAG: hypothetical protein MUC79_13815 [Thiobacillaceae bacterium]|nr:hypothetical protein [Thiobacillaceae bacterium]